MHEKYIPEHVDPFRLAEQGVILNGVSPLAEMSRLRPSMSSEGAVASAQFQFGTDEQGVCFLSGHVEAVLMLECQRCMEPFEYAIITDFALGVVHTLEESKQLPEQYDPVLVQDGQLALRELIEDELILNLPIIPKHAPESCRLTLPIQDSGWEQGEEKNPFRVLELLKAKQQKESGES
jgi:uncharacterized protein